MNEAERRTAPAPVEPTPASPVVFARSRTTTRDDDDDDGDEKRTVPFPARSRRGGGSPRLVDSQTPANLAFARSRPGGRAAPRPTSVHPPTAAAAGGAKEPGPADESLLGTGSGRSLGFGAFTRRAPARARVRRRPRRASRRPRRSSGAPRRGRLSRRGPRGWRMWPREWWRRWRDPGVRRRTNSSSTIDSF